MTTQRHLRLPAVVVVLALGTLYASGDHPHEMGLKGIHTSAKSALLTWNVVRVGSEDRRAAHDVAADTPPAVESTPGALSRAPAPVTPRSPCPPAW